MELEFNIKKHLRNFEYSYDSFVETEKINMSNLVRFEVFTAMTMQETVFWDLAPKIHGARSQKTVSCMSNLI
jgi:hypothetical protein